MNTISLCKTKENVLETIANWIFLLNHNIAVEEAAPPLLHSAFLCLQISSHPKTTKTGVAGLLKSTLYSAPIFGTDAALPHRDKQACKHVSPDLKINDRKIFGSCPFLCLYNNAFDLVRDIEVCTQLGSFGQTFAEPSFLYVAPAAALSNTPTK
eukprot:8487250-Ditylum_brightwellii.AAC.1